MNKPSLRKPNIRRPFRKSANKPVLTAEDRAIRKILSFIILATIILLAASGYYWYKNIFSDPQRVMSDMLDKSMQTSSIYRGINQNSASSTVNQTVFVGFSPQFVSDQKTFLEENSSVGRTRVSTESIGTPTKDFIQYTNIDVRGSNAASAQSSFADVINKWGKRESNPESGEQAAFLNDALFVVVPFGSLNADQRRQVRTEIAATKLYNVTKSSRATESGRPVMNMTVEVNPQSLVKVLAKYVEVTGVGKEAQLDPSQYEGVPAIQMNMQIDMLSRHLRSLTYSDSQRQETYFGYNAARIISEPNDTISIDELQTRLQKVEQALQAQ
jgi:hypothetical protein